jgi:CubicO group peptidase (beta-lactamase class C family)
MTKARYNKNQFLLLLLGSFCGIPAGVANGAAAEWKTATSAEMGLDASKLEQARDYALTADGSGCIIYKGKLVMSWGDQAALYDLKSSSKAIGVTLLGIAMKDGKVRLDDPAKKYHPTFGVPPETNAQTGWLDKITLRMLANQTAGFEKPGGYERLLFEPGTQWHYSDGGPNWLAECLTLVYGRDLNDLMFERVFTPIGIKPSDIRWRKHAYRPEFIDGIKRREFGSGFSANVNAMARIGYLYLREGKWNGEEILPASFIRAVREPDPALAKLLVHDPVNYGHASSHYSLLWWNNADGTIRGLPRDAHWSWGLYDSLIVVIPSLDMVIARAGPAKSWKREKGADPYDVLKPFLEPIAASARPQSNARRSALSSPTLAPIGGEGQGEGALHPLSPVIKEIRWAPTNTIIRRARGSDNWPLTWADDDHLYTAYGDGRGFEPFVPGKLSLGLAIIEGTSDNFKGINLHSPTVESLGDGVRGRKASGLLCVDGMLYLFVRNVTNSQLAWSSDHGATWTWADWKFTNSFGCPTFLNFGKNYAGARDDFVYVYSHDSDSAYERADRFVLARVPKNRIRERASYEFFVQRDDAGKPIWSREITNRGAVFANPNACYRSSISYNAALKRYLWCQTGAGEDTRFAGGFAIYDAPEPWGPWTTVFHIEKWDVGPGETMHLPTKWMSSGGKTVYLVFSGDDSFSVRQGTIVLKDQQ